MLIELFFARYYS